MSIITDNASINELKNKAPLFIFIVADKSEQTLSEKYDAPGLRYGDVK